MGKFHIGTSGWNYKHWRGVFYPEKLPTKGWFDFYSQHFDAVEINNAFYHQPDTKTWKDWHQQAPPGFRYAVKANRYLTHLKKLKEIEEPLEKFLSGAEYLKSYRGPLLYQLPPRWNKNLERLRQFAELLPGGLTHVIEFRDRDWLTEDTYELLEEYNISLCVHDLLPRHPRRLTGKVGYIRFHGVGEKYQGKYSPSRLESWAEWMCEAVQERDIFAYFNNDEQGCALQNARELTERLESYRT